MVPLNCVKFVMLYKVYSIDSFIKPLYIYVYSTTQVLFYILVKPRVCVCVGGNSEVILEWVCEPVFKNQPQPYTWPLKKHPIHILEFTESEILRFFGLN